MDTCGALLARGERFRFLLAEEMLFLAEAVEASAIAVIICTRRRGTQEERLLLDAFREEGFGRVGGVSAREERMRNVWFGACHGGFRGLAYQRFGGGRCFCGLISC